MLAPFLFVGLGGSGGKTLRTLRSELDSSLRERGWSDEFPKAWQFLHIDVPVVPDGNSPDLPPQLPPTQYLSLVPANVPYRDMDAALWAANRGAEATRNALAGWRPRTNEVGIPIAKGAGQFRTIGRVITLASLDKVKERLDQSFSLLASADIPGELRRLSDLFGIPAQLGANRPDPVVVLVTSIAGGSGAGMYLDVADVLRAVGGSPGDHSIGILYAPDVFDELPEASRRGVRPNALAAISELMAGYWTQLGPSEERDALYRSSGIIMGAADVSGPRYPLLVGRRNSRVSFGTQNDAYRAMGRALAAWVTDASIQDALGAYTVTNWEPTAQAVTDALPLKLGTQGTPFSALGFGRVSLGRPQFRRYAAEQLARESVDRVLREHTQRRRADDDRPDAALIEEAADVTFRQFVREARLNELGPEQNDILDALEAPHFTERLQRLVADVRAAIAGGDSKRAGVQWAEEIRAQTRRWSNDVRDELRAGSLDQARLWVDTSQSRLVDTTAHYMALVGGPVTTKLLDLLEQELAAVVGEMEREGSQFRTWAHQTEALAALAQVDARLEVTHPDVVEGVNEAANSVGYSAQAELRELAKSLIEEFRQNVVLPLRQSVRTAVDRLAYEETPPTGGAVSAIQTWPTRGEIPARFQPAVNERFLEPVEQYPQQLSTVVARTLDKDPEPAMRAAVQEIIVGRADATSDQRLISIEHSWAHSDYRLYSDPNVTQTRGSYRVHLGPEQIFRRADDWIARPDTAIGRMVHERLASYLRGDSAEAARRRANFRNQLEAAIHLADPLVNVNSGLLGVVHPGRAQPALHRVASQIPFSSGHPARRDVEETLAVNGWDELTIPGLFTEADRESVDVFTVLAEPYEAVVFDSVMKPIAEEWGTRKGDVDGRATFWRWRRSRPLAQSLPMAEAVRRSMVRGWFTARALGQIRTRSDGSTAIFAPSGTKAPGRMHDFPFPLLVDVSTESERLALTLKAIPLALTEVSTAGSLQPMEAYGRLRALGASAQGGLETYDSANAELRNWVLDAAVQPGAPTPPELLAGTADTDYTDRRDVLVARFESWAENYAELFDEVDRRTDVFDVARAWELREDILNGLQVLAEKVRHIEPADMRF